MTTPNAGLEGLVGLSERATGGQWIEDGGGWIGTVGGATVVGYAGCGSHDAEWSFGDMDFVIALVNWFRANHQSLPCAEGDARDADYGRIALHAFNAALVPALNLPDTLTYRIAMECAIYTALASRRELGGVSGEGK